MNNDKNKTKFTPGPWKYRIENGMFGRPTGVINGPNPNPEYSGEIPVCINVDKANAHLIAAAPDMFEALEAALGLALDRLGRESTGQRDHDLVDQISSALAKARGES